jgi:chemotaxis protein MotB
MVTYSDMITLVLAFFILLFSFSVIDNVKFQEILSSIRTTLTGAQGILSGSPHSPPLSESGEFADETLDPTIITFETIQTYIREAGLESTMTIYLEERGIILQISDALLFDPAKADLKPDALDMLTYMAEVLGRIDNPVIIEGHTDNVPINTFLFPSNWELSVARAVVVLRYLVESKGLAPERFAASGYGEFQPVDSNLTPEGRARNRRVNIVITSR